MVPAADRVAPADAVIVSFDVTTGDADAVAVDELDRGRRAACAAFFCLTKICAFRDPICLYFLYRVFGQISPCNSYGTYFGLFLYNSSRLMGQIPGAPVSCNDFTQWIKSLFLVAFVERSFWCLWTSRYMIATSFNGSTCSCGDNKTGMRNAMPKNEPFLLRSVHVRKQQHQYRKQSSYYRLGEEVFAAAPNISTRATKRSKGSLGFHQTPLWLVWRWRWR